MSLDPNKIKAIFLKAVEQCEPGNWSAFLDVACEGDNNLRHRVEILLQAHLGVDSLFDAQACGLSSTLEQLTPILPGTIIGPYKLLQQIGEGGMGVVFMAEQTQPVQRKVALKVIKPGMDSKQVIARFEAERQALAVMDHVNIARVIDGGTTGERRDASPSVDQRTDTTLLTGRPYFVMELINGVPITKYCDENHLTPRERLELFVPVCQAIQHAHQKGIIHRDIKPSNVLVTLYDGKPVPKVIDFGVAKATEQKLTERTLFTNFGTMVGTLEYMSPEQVEMSALGVDTRSDIYSLGVLLYELLTGSTPLSRQQMKNAAYAEILRLIKDDEPPKPSTRLINSGDALASISAQRKTEPSKLSKLMRGELDWIVMKTLEKDRNRRYETPIGLARDIQRYLADESVEACPPSASYRFRKFARRNRGKIIAVSVIVVLLILGTLGTSIGLARALEAERLASASAIAEAQQRQAAEAERDKAIIAEKQAKAEKQRADEEAAIAKAVKSFLEDDLLSQANPDLNARSKKMTVEELLDKSSNRLKNQFEQQPLVEASIRLTVGETYKKLSLFSKAQPHLERALELYRRVLGKEHNDTLVVIHYLTQLYALQGQSTKAIPLLLDALDIRQRLFGVEHRQTLNLMTELAHLYDELGQLQKAKELYLKLQEIIDHMLKEDDPLRLSISINLGLFYLSKGECAKAEQLFVNTLKLLCRVYGDKHSQTLICMDNLASVYSEMGQVNEAEQLYLKVLKIRRDVLGDHQDTITTMCNLAILYQKANDLPKAEPLYEKALEMSQRLFSEDHPLTLTVMDNLASYCLKKGDIAKGASMRDQVLERRRRVLGDDHPDTLASFDQVGQHHLKQREYAKAETIILKTLEIRRQKLGKEHPHTLNSMNSLGSLYWEQGKHDKAEPIFREAWELSHRTLGPENSLTMHLLLNRAEALKGLKRYDEAEAILLDCLRTCRQTSGNKHPSFLHAVHNLCDMYFIQKQFAKAEPLQREELELVRQGYGESSLETGAELAGLGLILLKLERYAEAEPFLRQALKIREAKNPDSWSLFFTKSVLGGSLFGQKRFSEAEPLLLGGFAGLLKHEKTIPADARFHLIDAHSRLVQLYQVTNQPEKARSWAEKSPKAKSPEK